MAINLIRTSQSAEFVHISDDAAVLPPEGAQWPGPSPQWLPAAGQPDACTRFRVRCMSADEVAECDALLPPSEVDADTRRAAHSRRAARVCKIGWLALDGAAIPADLGYGWQEQVAALIGEVTVAGPLARRP